MSILSLNVGAVRNLTAVTLAIFPRHFVVVSYRPPDFASDDHLLRIIAGNTLRGLVRNRIRLVVNQHPRLATTIGGIAMKAARRLLVRAFWLRNGREGVSGPRLID